MQKTDMEPQTPGIPGQSDNQVGNRNRPEELPPVTPPSAGYIIQLFLIPALIVAAVVSVWALFGKLADSETDWNQLVSELGSSNEHRRWRSALGLAQLLRNDELAPREGEVSLAEQPTVVDGLTGLLNSSLDARSTSDEDIRHQEFLARMMGSLRADVKVLPVLARAMSADYDIEVRRSALMSVAAIAGRHFEEATGYQPEQTPGSATGSRRPAAVELPLARPTISDAEVWKQLTLATQDPDPVIRQLATFAVASVSGPEAIRILRLTLQDADANTQANAAIGLARNGDVSGVATLKGLLKSSALPFERSGRTAASADEERKARAQYEVEQPIIARNCLKAVEQLWDRLTEADRTELRQVMGELSDSHFAADVRARAAGLLKSLPAAEPSA